MPLQAVEPQRLYRQIAGQLRALISQGELAVGSRLPAERDLARQLGVSRPSVREALIALEVEGWVDIRGGTGVFVSERQAAIPPETAHIAAEQPEAQPAVGPIELLDARDMVEPEVAALAAKNGTEETIGTLSRILGEMVCCASTDPRHMDLDHQFHASLADATGNGALVQVMETLWAMRLAPLYVQLQNHFHNEAVWQQAILEHREIYEAVRNHDAKTARAAMHRHVANARKRYVSNWQES